jgi:glutamate/tyrosine decarboxylase-like PLP-dependent enzyme
MTTLTDVRRAAVGDAAQRAQAYLDGSVGRRISPSAEARAALAALSAELPLVGSSAHDVLELLDRVGSPGSTVQTQGRFFGFVNGGVDPAAQAAAILTGAWDQNAALPVMSPAAARFDEIAAAWVVELLGLPPESVLRWLHRCQLHRHRRGT